MSVPATEPPSEAESHNAPPPAPRQVPESSPLQRRSLFAWLIDSLYGYDVFISYTRLDDPRSQYANALFVALTERRLRCFLDVHEIDRDGPLSAVIAGKVRASRTILFLGGTAAGDRRAVLDEAQLAIDLKKRVMILDRGIGWENSTSKLRTFFPNHLATPTQTEEHPSKATVEVIRRHVGRWRINFVRRMTILFAFIIVLALAAISFLSYRAESQARVEATKQRGFAEERERTEKLAKDDATSLFNLLNRDIRRVFATIGRRDLSNRVATVVGAYQKGNLVKVERVYSLDAPDQNWKALANSIFKSESYEQDLKELQKNVPPEKVRGYLSDWQQDDPDNPDPPILLVNWLLKRDTDVKLNGKTIPAGEFKIEIRGDNMIAVDSDGKEHLLKMEDRLDPKAAREALQLLKETRDRFPHRLDIHLGVAHIADMLKMPDEQFDALKAMARAARTHAGKLRWEWETPLEASEEAEIMWHLHNLGLEQYKTKTKDGLEHFLRIAQLMAEEFPRQAAPWNDLAVYYGEVEDWQNRQKVLEKAMPITPDDPVVLFNFGSNSRRLGLADRAASAFRKIIELNNDPKLIGWAHEQLREMGIEKKAVPADPPK